MSVEKINKISKLPIRSAYIYLSVPMYIFVFGWLKLPYGIITALALTVGVFFAWKDAPEMDIPDFNRHSIAKIIGIIAIAFIWVYVSGIGGFAYQNYDFMWRNGLLEKLVAEDFPVIIKDENPYFENPAALIYYFAAWLPAALVGKMWGIKAANIFLYLWCAAGILIVFSLLSLRNKKQSVFLVLAFIFFSGLDAVGDFILHNSTGYLWFSTAHIENWSYGFQMSSFCTQLFWVFNQAIPAWIITLLLLCQKNNRSVLFIYSFSFMACTLPAIGMIPILACIGIWRIIELYDKAKVLVENVKIILKDIFTFQNMCSGVILTLLSGMFLTSNTSTKNKFHMTDIKRLFMSYLIFCLLEFLVYYFAIYKYQKKNPLYWTSLAALLIVPTISFGIHVDFVMRASIPSLVVLFLLTADTLKICCEKKDKIKALVLTFILLCGSITSYHEILRSISTTIEHGKNTDISITAPEIDLFEDGYRNNFFGEYGDSVFFKYFVKNSVG